MFDWNEFFALAEKLRNDDDEASRRTAISRIYYAAYWKARIQLEDEGFILREFGKGMHEQVWDEYRRRGGRTNNAVFRKGDALKRNRIKADYKSESEISKDMVDDSFKIAESVFIFLEQVKKKEEN